MQPPGESWTIERDGSLVYGESLEHVRLVARTLHIEPELWRTLLQEYAKRFTPGGSVQTRLAALREAWADCSPHSVPVPQREGVPCPCCGEAVIPWLARRSTPLLLGRCTRCCHGVLLEGAASPRIYESEDYYQRFDSQTGAGYSNYAGEREFREAKGAQLLAWIEQCTGTRPTQVLEVGSGYGYSRKAAEDRGANTFGVDVNPQAAEHARALYGFDTCVGSLAQGLASGHIPVGHFDLVLYQFVLEHVLEPAAEIALAAQALKPRGLLAVVVPSSEATEIEVLGATYRSLRGDHLHLFSHRSIGRLLLAAGLDTVAWRSTCNIHVLRGFLSASELQQHVYSTGRGPDLTVLSRRL